MEKNNEKISAQQLYGVVVDTNRKVTELTKRKVKVERPALPFGYRLSILLMVFGAALVLSIIFPASKEFLSLKLSFAIWNYVFLSYAVITLTVAFLARINRAMRFATTVMAIAPLVVSVITSL